MMVFYMRLKYFAITPLQETTEKSFFIGQEMIVLKKSYFFAYCNDELLFLGCGCFLCN